ncbi:hypothetical protein Q0Z83_022170 [Actinoplanes sichuanensis]|uniref:Hsp70 protein n=1 Tax=Actinoplanes sichuanensis TaxID=512349 RepID=A0ABW4AJT2_9ACTN|nr:hypothetical protein [Actinoplanes sichuanensis]BEL04026.1 hypothetical protein Q0Z83_022170 [Actinoplanes sichuanensis]
MDVELEFVAAGDGTPRRQFTLDPTAGPVTPPTAILSNRLNRPLVIAAITVVAAGDDRAGAAARFAAAWQPEVPPHGIDLPALGRYMAPWRQIPATDVPPGRVAYAWSLTVAERLPDGRLRAVETIRHRCLIEVPVAVPPEPEPAAATQPQPQPQAGPESRPEPAAVPDGPVHDGWIAIDYGMSNSTVTMFDQSQKRALIGLPPTQTAVLRDLLNDLLTEEGDDFGLDRAQWRRVLESVGRALAAARPEQSGVAPLEQVRLSMAGDGVFDVLLGLDRQAAIAPQRERDELAAALERLSAKVFSHPPIEEMQLIPIALHAGEPSISSDAHVLGLKPFRLAMWDDGETDVDDDVPLAVEQQPGLKRFLGNPRPLPGLPSGTDRPDTQQALTALWQRLLHKIEEFREREPDRYSPGRIDRAVVTYPTTAPPQTRLDMEELARSVGIRIVDTRFDEATAAAMFSLMRQFSGDHATGIEAFRARSRPVIPADTGAGEDTETPVHEREWRYNTLVIDIGGGSTDVALLGLTLADCTERDPTVPPDQQGRYYELRPTVLGKAGDLQLGGDRITLGIFRLLKVKLADAVLTASPGMVLSDYENYVENGRYLPGSLLARPGGPDDLIDAAVPTRWAGVRTGAEARAARERFRRLWDEAERAKRASADQKPYPVRNIADLLQLPTTGDLPATFSIDWADVCGEIDKVLVRSIEIGLSVARKRLSEVGGRKEPLDTIILSGGTSALPRTRQLLHRIFAEETAENRRDALDWNPLRVVHDPDFAKLGTSIGACWAYHIDQKGFADREAARQRVAMGRTEIHIDVDNLLHVLPYGLTLSAHGMDAIPIFTAGQEFERVGAKGEGTLRSGWYRAVPDLTINRKGFSTAEVATRWGHLNLASWALDHEDPDRFSLDEWRAARIQVQFEIGETDLLHAYFCLGEPDYAIDLTDGRRNPEVAGPGPDGDPRLLTRLYVNPDAAGGLSNHAEVLLEPSSTPDGYLVPGGESERLACWISARLPRRAPRDGLWWVYRQDPDDRELMRKVGTPIPAIRHGRGADTRIVVDAYGRVSAVSGYVPYVAATSMADVLENPGSVLKVPMEAGKIDMDRRFDPFNGSH